MLKSHHSIIFQYTAVQYGYSSQLIALPDVLFPFLCSLRTSATVPLVLCGQWGCCGQIMYYQNTYYQNRSHMPSPLCIHLCTSSTSISGKVVGSTSQDTVDSSSDQLDLFLCTLGADKSLFSFQSHSTSAMWSWYVFRWMWGEYFSKHGWCWEWYWRSKFLLFI